MAQTTKQFYTPREMAEIIGVQVVAIRKAIADGEMPAVRLGAGRNSTMRVQQEDFWAWVAAKKQGQGAHHGSDH